MVIDNGHEFETAAARKEYSCKWHMNTKKVLEADIQKHAFEEYLVKNHQ